MARNSGMNFVQAVLLCCIAFVAGHASAVLGQVSCLIHPVVSDKPVACDPTIAPKRNQLEQYVTELIKSTISVETLMYTEIADEKLRKLLQEALIHALAIEKFKCEPSSTVVSKSTGGDAPTIPPKQLAATATQQQPILPRLPRRRRLPATTKYITGVAKVNRTEFNSIIDTGLPLAMSKPPEEDVLVFYGTGSTRPTNTKYSDMAVYADDSHHYIPTNEAIENCQQLAIIHVARSKTEANCWAILPGRESFHIQKWLRVDEREGAKLDIKQPLRLVSRGYDRGLGVDYPDLPSTKQAEDHRIWLGGYFQNVDVLVKELQPLVEKVAVQKQLIVTVVNSGQSALLVNFACAAKSRGFKISNVLVFVIDEELKEVVEGLGMTAYYNEKFLGSLPSRDPKTFGDYTFTEIVISKFMCTHLLSIMGYDFLFQDVDIVWYKDPLEFFNNPELADPKFDIYFQDDLNDNIRYQPLRGNSGFYYVRHNRRTVAAMKDAVLKTDQLFAARSHQQTLLELLHEHISYHGLRVKVYDGEDTDYFPGGHHFQRNKRFMQAFLRGEKDAYLFHINWTNTLLEKVKYLRQMGG